MFESGAELRRRHICTKRPRRLQLPGSRILTASPRRGCLRQSCCRTRKARAPNWRSSLSSSFSRCPKKGKANPSVIKAGSGQGEGSQSDGSQQLEAASLTSSDLKENRFTVEVIDPAKFDTLAARNFSNREDVRKTLDRYGARRELCRRMMLLH
jgi:hypothetical protein